MIETFTYNDVLSKGLLHKYGFLETGSATQIAQTINPEAFADIVGVLEKFCLTSQLLLTKGGNRGPVPQFIDGSFEKLGWEEARIDLYKRAFMFPGQRMETVKDDPFGSRANEFLVSETYQEGYSVDNVKERIALDVEWNAKDGNLDRDFSAYRAWHDEGLIDVAVLITRIHEDTKRITREAWNEYIASHPEHSATKQLVDYTTTTTTNFEKARERILRGDLGTCPILVVGIGEKTWDKTPWNGCGVQYMPKSGELASFNAFEKIKPSTEYSAVSDFE